MTSEEYAGRVQAAASTASRRLGARETIGCLDDGAQCLLGLIERLSQTREACDAERIRYHCDFLSRAAYCVQLTLMAETVGAGADDQ